MLNNIQRFFAHHLIETFGCDYSTSGMTLEALQAKIKSFFELRPADGPRHDTYVIFYSGHTHRSGDWALAGKRGDVKGGDYMIAFFYFKLYLLSPNDTSANAQVRSNAVGVVQWL